MEESSVAPSPEAGTQHFLGKGCLLPWEQAITHSLPLARRGTNRYAAFTPLKGRTAPCVPLWPPSSHQMACGVAGCWEQEASGSGALH